MSCTGSTRFTLMAAGCNFAHARIQPDLRALSVPVQISNGTSDSHV
jgi:hypothetical protein